MKNAISSKIEAVDLFCGAGGLTAGLIKSGIAVKAGYDIEESCRFAYEHNNHGSVFINKDIKTVSSSEISSHYSKDSIRLLSGCAPCQPFSKYNENSRMDLSADKKWPLLYEFARLISDIQPELITMENVPNVIKHNVYHDFVDTLVELGYEVCAQEVFCPDYGIPQARKRHVLLASRIGKIELIAPTHRGQYMTVKDAIYHLPSITAGADNKKDPLHRSTLLSPINIERIKSSKPGGTWADWPEKLRLACHKKESGNTYKNVYGRMEWDRPSPTMTTQCFGYGNGRFGHPEQNRAISLREAAIFQTFPECYQFFDSDKHKTTPVIAVGKMIGNAVPVRLGEIIGRSMQLSLI